MFTITVVLCTCWRMYCGGLEDDVRFAYYQPKIDEIDSFYYHIQEPGLERINSWPAARQCLELLYQFDTCRLANVLVILGQWLLPPWFLSVLGGLTCALLPIVLLYIAAGSQLLKMRWPSIVTYFVFFLFLPWREQMNITAFFANYIVFALSYFLLLAVLRKMIVMGGAPKLRWQIIAIILSFVTAIMHEMGVAMVFVTMTLVAIGYRPLRRVAVICVVLSLVALAIFLTSPGVIRRMGCKDENPFHVGQIVQATRWSVTFVVALMAIAIAGLTRKLHAKDIFWPMAILIGSAIAAETVVFATWYSHRSQFLPGLIGIVICALLYSQWLRKDARHVYSFPCGGAVLAALSVAIYSAAWVREVQFEKYYYEIRGNEWISEPTDFGTITVVYQPEEREKSMRLFELSVPRNTKDWHYPRLTTTDSTIVRRPPSQWPNVIEGNNDFIYHDMVMAPAHNHGVIYARVTMSPMVEPSLRNLLIPHRNDTVRFEGYFIPDTFGVYLGDTIYHYQLDMTRHTRVDAIRFLDNRRHLRADVTVIDDDYVVE